jgi:hypothetical protein
MPASQPLRVHLMAVVLLAPGVALPAAAQDAGPMAPAPVVQSAPDKGPAQNPAPATPASRAASTPAAPMNPIGTPAKIVVPAGTHIPLVLHNGISTRSAQAGDPDRHQDGADHHQLEREETGAPALLRAGDVVGAVPWHG